MQFGLLVLHAERARRFQRRVVDGRDDSVAAEDSQGDGLNCDYGWRAYFAGGHRGVGGGGAVSLQVSVGALDYQWDFAGPQAGDFAGCDWIGGEFGCAGSGPVERAFETGGAAEGFAEFGDGERS